MQQPNAQTFVEVTRDELPIHCPTPDSSLWNSHPRVYIPLDDSPEASCAYCGTVYRLVTEKSVTAARLAGDDGSAERAESAPDA
ncbi:zinc-finger domain-containing protein [Granulosicoccus sp. 3-233]|uniref:zinc-finger domain-containing protein n=1 Tax=Granulosicoccus sp. 3-233 TaxID=3417969 RepID=UPI003D340C5C